MKAQGCGQTGLLKRQEWGVGEMVWLDPGTQTVLQGLVSLRSE